MRRPRKIESNFYTNVDRSNDDKSN